MPNKIFAVFDEKKIRVYQAFNNAIADEAIRLGTFGDNFKRNRMTWIKPSFLWMMYRSGWGEKEEQNRILAIDMARSGFDHIVSNAVPSSFSPSCYESYDHWKKALESSEIRRQWDPERDIYGNPQMQRTIQLGIKGVVLDDYVSRWNDGAGYNSDSSGPLSIPPERMKMSTLFIDTENCIIEIQFTDDYLPETVVVQRWNTKYVENKQDYAGGYFNGEPVPIDGFTFRISDDGDDYIYEVHATWLPGNSYYAFMICAATQD
jgi:hypothetical protein